MVVRKYSQGQILISGQVDLEFSWEGKMIVSSVYIHSDKETGKPLLVGMNSIIHLGLMQPATGVRLSKIKKNSPSIGTARLVKAEKNLGRVQC